MEACKTRLKSHCEMAGEPDQWRTLKCMTQPERRLSRLQDELMDKSLS
jgi:hypothetical protein